ncbi:MAG: PAS domain S-box protein, partial [Myxococcales bacterium]|nr:PAS domain S-box protein [Myxococcales bacterium]
MRLSLRWKLALFLLIPLLGAATIVGFFLQFLDETRDYPALINVSGRQRMLAVQLGAYAEMVRAGHREHRALLRAKILEYDEALAALEDGGLDLARPLPPPPAALRPRVQALRSRWRRLRPRLEAFAARQEVELGDGLAPHGLLHGEIERLAGTAHELTGAYEARSEAARDRMLVVLLGGGALNLLLLGIGVLLTHRALVRPLLAAREAAEGIAAGDFSRRLPVVTGDELGMLAASYNIMASRFEALAAQSARAREEAELLNENLPLGALVLDPSLRILSSNRAFRRHTGLDREALIGRPLAEILPLERITSALSPEPNRSTFGDLPEVELSGTDGVVRTFACSGLAMQIPRSEERGHLLLLEEVSEAHRFEEQARASEARFRAVVENATDAILLLDAELRIEYFNRAAESIFGYARAEVIGKRIESLLGDERAADVIATRAAPDALSEGSFLFFEGRRKDGACFPVELSMSLHQVGERAAVAVVLRDVTKRERAAEALRRSEESFRALIEGSPDAVGVHRDGRFVYVNPVLVDLLGYERPEQILGKPIAELVHPEDRAMVLQRVQRMLSTGERVPPVEERFLHRDGHAITCEVAAIPLVFEGEAGIAAVGRDVSDRVQLTARMMQMDRMIAVGTLAAGVGHEINNPLAYIMANLDFLEQELPRLLEDLGDGGALGASRSAFLAPSGLDKRIATVAEVLQETHEGAQRVRAIVQDLRTFSHQVHEERSAVAIDEVVRRAIDMTTNEVRHRATLETRLCSSALVHANEGRLAQVLVNLLVNAAHAIPEGEADENRIRVETAVVGDRVRVEI